MPRIYAIRQVQINEHLERHQIATGPDFSKHIPNVKLRERLGLNLQNARRQQKLSQEDLALLAGVDRSYVSQIELSKASVSVDIIERLSQALTIDPIELLRH
ncbi:MAG: helix-turn-helix domain-containing protein [Cognatishimia sp.]